MSKSGASGLPDIDRLAELSMLSVSPGEREELRRELAGFVAFADRLTLPDGAEEDEAYPGEGVLREDEPLPGLTRDELLANAPEVRGGCIVVPRVVGD